MAKGTGISQTKVKSPSRGTAKNSVRNTRAKTAVASKNKAAAGAHGRETTHVVRVNVLGLAGITVDRKRCKDLTSRRGAPVVPAQMKTVVAFSRGKQIYGTTVLSKTLARSPNDDVVVPKPGGEGVSVRHSSSAVRDNDRVQRHVAVWASDDDATLGSMVYFEVALSTLKKADGRKTAYAPQGFELTMALTEDSDQECKVALPFGIANLNVGDDKKMYRKPVVMDLPVLSLKEAKPLSSHGKPYSDVIVIRPKKTEAEPKKKNGLKRLFGSRNASTTSPKMPSVAQRKAFAETYSTDASGDAVLRVQVQIVPKKMELGHKAANSPRDRAHGRVSSGSATRGEAAFTSNRRRRKRTTADRIETVPEDASLASGSFDNGDSEYSYDSDSSCDSDDDTDTDGSHTHDGSLESYRGDSTCDGTFDDTVETGSGTGNEYDDDTFDGSAQDSSTVNTLGTNTVHSGSIVDADFFAENEDSTVDDTLDGTFDSTVGTNDQSVPNGRRSKRNITDKNSTHTDAITNTMFGEGTWLPTCGSPQGRQTDKNRAKPALFDDDLTQVTADFFGKDVRVPICSALKPPDDDDDDEEETQPPVDNGASVQSVHPNSKAAERLRAMMEKAKEVANGIRFPDVHQKFASRSLERSLGDHRESTPKDTDGKANDNPNDGPDGDPNDNPNVFDIISAGLRDGRYKNGRFGAAIMKSVAPAAHDDDLSAGQPKTEAKAKGSPKGVTELTNGNVKGPAPESRPSSSTSSFSQRFAQMFVCGSPRDGVEAKIFGEEADNIVPELIIPNDDKSVGDLTATTHEMWVSAGSSYDAVAAAQVKSGQYPLPVACGGSGMCNTMGVVAVKAEIERHFSKGKRVPSMERDYFAEYEKLGYRSRSLSAPDVPLSVVEEARKVDEHIRAQSAEGDKEVSEHGMETAWTDEKKSDECESSKSAKEGDETEQSVRSESPTAKQTRDKLSRTESPAEDDKTDDRVRSKSKTEGKPAHEVSRTKSTVREKKIKVRVRTKSTREDGSIDKLIFSPSAGKDASTDERARAKSTTEDRATRERQSRESLTDERKIHKRSGAKSQADDKSPDKQGSAMSVVESLLNDDDSFPDSGDFRGPGVRAESISGKSLSTVSRTSLRSVGTPSGSRRTRMRPRARHTPTHNGYC